MLTTFTLIIEYSFKVKISPHFDISAELLFLFSNL